jgi:hypothetical protein
LRALGWAFLVGVAGLVHLYLVAGRPPVWAHQILLGVGSMLGFAGGVALFFVFQAKCGAAQAGRGG